MPHWITRWLANWLRALPEGSHEPHRTYYRMNAPGRIRRLLTSTGFEIAELDLRLRGPGEFMGTRQSGLPALRVANLLRDRDILEQARRLAMDFVEKGDRQELSRLVYYIKENWNRRYGLVTVG